MYLVLATGISVAAIIAARRHNNSDPSAGNVVAGFGVFLLLVALGNCHTHF
jgi:hypothetical protein